MLNKEQGMPKSDIFHRSTFLVRYSLGSAHTFQMRCMRNDGMPHLAVFNIFYAVLFAGLFNDLADGRVVDVRNLREEVMLYLEIQSAYQPGNEFIPGRKVCRGLYLVDGPFVLNFIDVFGRNRESGFFNGMCQLKNNA